MILINIIIFSSIFDYFSCLVILTTSSAEVSLAYFTMDKSFGGYYNCFTSITFNFSYVNIWICSPSNHRMILKANRHILR